MDATWSMSARETELQRTADGDLPALAIADEVSRLLVEVIQSISLPPQEELDSKDLRLQALWFMAIIALRAMRAAMQALRSGYEDQAVGYQRLIDELHNRAKKVLEDSSGEYARQWLLGRGLGKGAKLAGRDFWDLLSGPVHANARAIFDWLAVSEPDGTTKVVIGPERRAPVANAALTYMASESRDLAVGLALEAGRSLQLATLDAGLKASLDQWVPDHDQT
jgi:hypothetical protein